MSEIISVIDIIYPIAVIIVVLFLTFYASKWIAKRSSVANASKYMKIVDRIALAQDKSIVIVNVGLKYYLVSLTQANIAYLCELQESDLIEQLKPTVNPPNFKDIFKKVMDHQNNQTITKGRENE